jgi:septum formation protein
MLDKQIPRIVLASTSSYRKLLLNRLQIPFETADPGIEEFSRPEEDPLELSLRLAHDKAFAVSETLSYSLPYIVIGSDQVAHMGSHILPKPGTFEKAAKQLAKCSGNWVSFTTAISLIDHRGIKKQAVECFRIKFRELNNSEIDEYLKIDEPFDCAGSIKAESTGITLLEDTDGRDFNTLVGLPLMLCQQLLDDYGYRLSTLRKSPI